MTPTPPSPQPENGLSLSERIASKLFEMSSLRHGMATPREFLDICKSVLEAELQPAEDLLNKRDRQLAASQKALEAVTAENSNLRAINHTSEARCAHAQNALKASEAGAAQLKELCYNTFKGVSKCCECDSLKGQDHDEDCRTGKALSTTAGKAISEKLASLKQQCECKAAAYGILKCVCEMKDERLTKANDRIEELEKAELQLVDERDAGEEATHRDKAYAALRVKLMKGEPV